MTEIRTKALSFFMVFKEQQNSVFLASLNSTSLVKDCRTKTMKWCKHLNHLVCFFLGYCAALHFILGDQCYGICRQKSESVMMPSTHSSNQEKRKKNPYTRTCSEQVPEFLKILVWNAVLQRLHISVENVRIWYLEKFKRLQLVHWSPVCASCPGLGSGPHDPK